MFFSCKNAILCCCQIFQQLRIFLIVFGILSILIEADNYSSNSDNNGICRSVDIRSTTANFKKLEGCRVVEGNVHILLLDHYTPKDFLNVTFPELTEITGFLLLYRVEGLETLGKMFPNLTVIRGRELLYNHAFIIFELSSIQEIGLYSLTNIERGAVYISKNPNLCFSSTIDWGLIVKQGSANNVITFNKIENECGLCRGDEKNGYDVEKDSHVKTCPVAFHHEYSGKYSPQPGRHLCWNRDNCQKVCPKECGNNTCNSKGQCCKNDQCLGDCYGANLDRCKVCKNLSIWKDGESLCMQKCPVTHNYVYLNRRCVSADQCRNITKPKGDLVRRNKPHKPFNGSCLLDCPLGYEEDEINGQLSCKKCEGKCVKRCGGASVNSIHTAQSLKDCTIINGSLDIQLRDDIVHELNENLGQITEITGYLKVTRSYPLMSLGFLKNLRIIRGYHVDAQNGYSLIVKDNQNLQELWDFSNHTNHKLQILNGRVQFHHNPKLCIDKIDALVAMIGLKNVREDEIQRKTNGDKIACNLVELPVNCTLNMYGATLEWRPFKMTMNDERHLLGYVVFWMKTDRKNISIYESRDACGGDGWNVDDVLKPTGDDFIYHPLTKLESYTNYAVYVETYTIASEPFGAQSKILYFRTLPGVPTSVTNLSAVSNDSSYLLISWNPPLKPNGEITHYKIKLEVEKPTSPDQRNYCEDGPKETTNVGIDEPPDRTSENGEDDSEKNATNKKTKSELKDKEPEAEAAASFEDALQNWVFVKRPEYAADKLHERNKREITNGILNYANSSRVEGGHSSGDKNNKSEENGTIFYETSKTMLVISNLKHYREYTVKVKACRQLYGANDNESRACSVEAFKTQRTLAKPGADNVTNIQLEIRTTNKSLGVVKLTWNEPSDPNGVIQTYQIEYKQLDIENAKPTVVCITRKKFRDQMNSYPIKDLSPGNYSLRLRATSLGGEGSYSAYKYFYIPPASSSSTFQVALGVVISIVIVILTLAALFLYFRRYYLSNVPNMKLIASVNPEYVSTAYVPDDWEVPRKKIELLRELGQGSFGMVYEGVAHDVVKGVSQMRCAIKTVNEHATDRERIEFLNEASVMKAFDTAHVVRLLGVVSQGQPTLVIMELMSNGDLKSYLRSHRPEEQDANGGNPRRENPPSLKRVLQMAIEIADGMAYLTAKKFVHRDLAARNCMVADNLTVKIGDFGMTRDIYETDYYRKGSKGLLPVRWMAPESLKDGVFQSSSDVWSYGVVLWEMATLASQPYQGLSNEQVLRYVIDGGVMERPENCPDKLYELMRLCWQHKSSARPTFLELASILLADASNEFREVAFYFTKAGQEALAAQTLQIQDEAEATTPLRPVNTADEDEFSLDSCSDREDGDVEDGSVDMHEHEGRVSFPGSSFLTAAYHDKSEPNSVVNGFISIQEPPMQQQQAPHATNTPTPTSNLNTTTQC
ncbi:insulin-like receptor isoform X2 [Chrysoperla carnea]|uniref:insulin-like receptor isoform X2 n=1 Tax=Chrysoperla carnea TaxID=189513 RepID=UPI001D0657D1|nr:insulin-like receptor isoform X2 [Chrysoperla carnea]